MAVVMAEGAPAAHLRWAKGGEADLVALDGERVRLWSTASSAPGARVEGALSATGTAIRVKVARCRLIEDASAAVRRYEIEGRLIDATREVRAELARLVGVGVGVGVGDRPRERDP